MQRAIHRLDGDAAPALRDPCVDSVDESRIGRSLCVFTEPLQVDDTRIVSTARLELNISGLAITSKDPTHHRAANTEHFSRRLVRRRESLPIGVSDASSQIELDIHPDF